MAVRYCNVFRHRPSGREEKRLLNRARKCGFCPEPLDDDRALFRAYTGFTDFELVPAHWACGEAEPAKIDARRAREEAERAARSARYAAEMRARSRLIVVEAAPATVRPAAAWQMPGFTA